MRYCVFCLCLGCVLWLAPSGLTQTTVTEPARVVLPEDAEFKSLDVNLKNRAKLRSISWSAEIAKRVPLGESSDSRGVRGIFFYDALLVHGIVAGTMPYVVFGLLQTPPGSSLSRRELVGKHGLVVFGGSFAVALIDLTTDSVVAFVALKSLESLPNYNLGPMTVFSPGFNLLRLLFGLVTVTPTTNGSSPSTPRAMSDVACPDLPNKQRISVPMGGAATVLALMDEARKPVFSVRDGGPVSLTVISFTGAVSFVLNGTSVFHIGAIIGPGESTLELPVESGFRLLITQTLASKVGKTACIDAIVRSIGTGLVLNGTASFN